MAVFWPVDGGACCVQEPHAVAVALMRGSVQRRAAFAGWPVNGSMGGEQQQHHATVALAAGDVQRCAAPAVWPVDGSSGGKQQLHTVAVTFVTGSVKGRAAFVGWPIEGGVGDEQQLHATAMAMGTGSEQRCPAVAVLLVDGGVAETAIRKMKAAVAGGAFIQQLRQRSCVVLPDCMVHRHALCSPCDGAALYHNQRARTRAYESLFPPLLPLYWLFLLGNSYTG